MDHWFENEDCDVTLFPADFTASGEGEYRMLVNLQGPGGVRPYHFFARLEAGVEDPFLGFEAGGDPAFEFNPEPVAVAGTPPGYQWFALGSITRGRQYLPLTVRALPGLPGLHSLWVSQVPRHLLSGRAERRLALPYPEPLSGVPLGGVGAGKLELCRDGRFRNFTLNGGIDTPTYQSDGTFVAIRAGGETRILCTESLHGLPAMAALDFEGRYPQARLASSDPAFPVQVELRASATIVPHNLRDASLPLALFTVRLTNPGTAPLEATIAFSAENLLGCSGTIARSPSEAPQGFYEYWDEREGNTEAPWGDCGVLLRGEEKTHPTSAGSYLLASAGPVSAGGWRLAEGVAVWQRFGETGELPSGPTAPSTGEATAGVLGRTLTLAPGQTAEIRFVWAWYVPLFQQVEGPEYGRYYANHFASVAEVAAYGLQEFDRLWTEAAAIPEALRESSLPAWLSQSLANDAYVLSTDCWLTRDGRFSVNESPKNMFGCMGTLDQKLYGSHYYSLFFPELDASELLQFARAQAEDGGIQHDLGYGHLEQRGRASGWPDLSSSLAIQTLKLYQLTGDEAFLDEMYPHCVRALLEWQLSRDTDNDGIANISGVGNTFDSEKFEGTSAYIATVWLAALLALEEMARRRGDSTTQARAREAFTRARQSAIDELWNGSYFANYYDVNRGLRSDNSHFSQLAGEFYSLLLGLGYCYGEDYALTAQRSVLRLNYPDDYAMPMNEATAEGQLPRRDLHGWLPHARVYLGGLSFLLGMPGEGLRALERMDAVLREVNHDNRWDQRLFYEPDTGREHWGTFYMTAPATWYAYQALLGVLWDKPAGVLGLCPHLPASLLPFRAPVFLPDLWAELTVSADCAEISFRPTRRFRRTGVSPVSLPVRRLRLPSGREARGGTPPSVTADAEAVTLAAVGEGPGYVEYSCDLDLAQVGQLLLRLP